MDNHYDEYSLFYISHKLSKTVSELKDKLTFDEYYKWVAFFNIELLKEEIKIIHGY